MGHQALLGHLALLVGLLMVVVGRQSPYVAPASFKEAQLRVIEDVEVGAAQAVACGSHQQVPVVFPALPPHREVERAAAEL